MTDTVTPITSNDVKVDHHRDGHKHHSRDRHRSISPDRHHRHRSHRSSSKHSRHRSRSPSKHRKHKHNKRHSKHRKHHRSRYSSSSDDDSSSSDDYSDSDSHDDRRRKHKKHRRHRRHHSRSRSPDEKDKLLAELERKSRQHSQYNLNNTYGQHGILDAQLDHNNKTSEFTAWLLDIHGVVMETLSKHDRKRLFADYVESYNTGTLTSQKYVDYDAFTKQGSSNNNVHDTHNRIDDVSVAMSDEDRLRAERLQLHASLKQKIEQQRMDAAKQALLQKKESDPEYYAKLNADTQFSAPSTFESIAKERERRKREAERKAKYG